MPRLIAPKETQRTSLLKRLKTKRRKTIATHPNARGALVKTKPSQNEIKTRNRITYGESRNHESCDK